MCDFIYQINQIGINNFSKNSLFDMFALEDLIDMLNIKLILFEYMPNKQLYDYKLYEPSKVCENAFINISTRKH